MVEGLLLSPQSPRGWEVTCPAKKPGAVLASLKSLTFQKRNPFERLSQCSSLYRQQLGENAMKQEGRIVIVGADPTELGATFRLEGVGYND